jgi:mannan endo-1,4-beta-mannosidase
MSARDEFACPTPAQLNDAPQAPLAWVQVAPRAPYFATDDGEPWTPVGHNDAISWPPLMCLLDRTHEPDAYFRMLQSHGITCLRLMLEYSQHNHHLLERPAGHFQPRMVARWDRLFSLAQQYSIRVLLTPFDTFWMWKRWRHHPYNAANGGPCRSRRVFLICPATRAAIKRRLAFAIDRWGGDGALFAWDLWNEIHPAYAQDDVGHFDELIADLAAFVRERERARYGRARPITVSAFGPMLHAAFGSKELGHTTPDARALEAVFRHPALDFATVHTYAHGTIDDPANTVDPAVAMGALTRTSLLAIHDRRPFLDSEHGPIHTFKDKRRTLPEGFDDEYFRHVQWAHLASGAAGGGMRWPNRRPHVLTPGMHAAQRALVSYLPLVDWPEFDRRNLNEEIRVSPAAYAVFGCGDQYQVAIWIVRREPLASDGTVARVQTPDRVTLRVPGLISGTYQVTTFNTEAGMVEARFDAATLDGALQFDVPLFRDLALAIRPAARAQEISEVNR